MKTLKIKLLFYIFSTFMVLGVVYLAYLSYTKVETYQQSLAQSKEQVILSTLSQYVAKIDHEELNAAIYANRHSNKDFQVYKQAQKNTDALLNHLLKLSENDADLSALWDKLSLVQNNLVSIRSRVKTLEKAYQKEFISHYYKDAIVPLLETLHIKQEALKEYLTLEKIHSNAITEKNYISYMLTKNNKDAISILHLWEEILDDKFSLNLMQDKVDISFNSDLSRHRESIVKNIFKNKNGVSLDTWVTTYNKNLALLANEKKMLFKSLHDAMLKEKENLKNDALQYIVFTLILLFIFIVATVIYRHTGAESKLLDDTLKDIEDVLDFTKQRELKALIDDKDTPGVYAFLTKTIREANEAKDLFLANMSHEIRTPLNGIVGFTELLKSSQINHEQKEYIDIIETSSSNLLTIVNDILDLAKIRSNKVELENIRFSLIETCESAVEIYAAKAYEKNIKINLFTDTNMPNSVLGDPTKLTQILTNLISNAVKFTPYDGNIDVAIINEAEFDDTIKVKFLVEDSGIGISSKQKDKIFEAFSQADASTNRKFGGTGLGLSISSKFVEIMGGKLDLESEEKKGTTFFFTLTLEKIKNDTSRFHIPQLEDIHIGYLLPEGKQGCNLTSNLEKYIHATSASFTLYDETQIKNITNSELPDILFVRHRDYTENNDILNFLEKLDISKVLITMPHLKDLLPAIKTKFEKVIYEPIYLTKTIKALENVETHIASSNTIVDTLQIAFPTLKALVVEDNNINQKLIKAVLEGMGIEVTLAHNGREGVEKRKTNSYDIIFMDIQMPVLGGIEATKEILVYEKSTNQTHIPIIALTANALKGDKEKYLAHGMDNYASKPLDIGHIQSLLVHYCSDLRRNIENEKQAQNMVEDTSNRILLYTEVSLVSKIFAQMLDNLNFDVDTSNHVDDFLDTLEAKKYDYVLFDSTKLGSSFGLLMELIEKSGAQPVALTAESDYTSMEKHCISIVPDIEEIKRVLRV